MNSEIKNSGTRAEFQNLVEEATRLRSELKGYPSQPNIYVVDDDETFCGVTTQLLTNVGFQVRTYGTANDFLREQIPDAPGCILVDLHLPGLSGLDLQSIVSSQPNSLPIIFVSADGSIPSVVRAMKAGAMDFLTKPVGFEILLDAVNRSVAFSHRQQNQKRLIAKRTADFHTLSHREREVFELVVTGKMNKEIASELGIRIRTVKVHRGNVMAKMHVQSLAELVHVAGSLPRSTNSLATSHR